MAISASQAYLFAARVVERLGKGTSAELLEILREQASGNKSVQVSFERLAEAIEREIKGRK